eukprot:SAG22_NODE_134_length_18372_cov_33.054944_3_plen_432_part_00
MASTVQYSPAQPPLPSLPLPVPPSSVPSPPPSLAAAPPLLFSPSAPMSSSAIAADADKLEAYVSAILEQAGSSPAEAAVVADHLVGANLKGHDSHGVGMLASYTDQLLNGDASGFGCKIVPNDKIVASVDTGPMLIFEAGGSFGQASARAAMEAAVARAKETGICMLGLRNANHIGRVGTYGEIATAAGMVSLHFVNVYHTLVAPDGGRDQRFGTNPVCLAVPGTAANPGVQLDMATSIAAMGKVSVKYRAGEQTPDGWLIDSDGEPTNDPAVMHVGRLAEAGRGNAASKPGALLAFGGYKGWGLSLFCELLGSSLIGGATIAEKGVPKSVKRINSMMAIVIDPEAARAGGAGGGLAAEIDTLVDYAKASGPGVRIPNEPEQQYAAGRRAAGVPLDGETWRQINQAAADLGLDGATAERLAAACIVTAPKL